MSSAEQKQKHMANKNQNLSTPKVGHAEDSEREKNNEGKAILRERSLQLGFH